MIKLIISLAVIIGSYKLHWAFGGFVFIAFIVWTWFQAARDRKIMENAMRERMKDEPDWGV